jgi:hypothetical protein
MRGFFGSVDASCLAERVTSTPVYLLGGFGDVGAFVEFGVAATQVRTVVFLTDDGSNWSTPAVRPGSAHFRFFASLDPHGARGGIPEPAWKGADGVLHRVVASSDFAPALCPKSESPLQGIPDGLPRAGSTKYAAATAIAFRARTALMEQYGANDVRVESRNGQVWLPSASGPKVVEAADALLRLYLPSASRCPQGPHAFDGVPLSFAVGSAPPAPSKNVAEKVPRRAVPPTLPIGATDLGKD